MIKFADLAKFSNSRNYRYWAQGIEQILVLPFRFISPMSINQRRSILVALDILIFLFSVYAALNLRFDGNIPDEKISLYAIPGLVSIGMRVLCFYLMGIYRPLLRYSGINLLEIPIKATLLSEIVLFLSSRLLNFVFLPRSVQVISAFVSMSLVMSLRLFIRRYVRRESMVAALSKQNFTQVKYPIRSPSEQKVVRVIIYGAGSAGSILSSTLSNKSLYEVVAFVDQNSKLQDREINGVRIYQPRHLAQLVENHSVNRVLLAIPSASPMQRKAILDQLKVLNVEILSVPSLDEIVSGQVSISRIRPINVLDYLGRKEVMPDPKLLSANITDRVVLVTGAGGSIGSELCRQIVRQKPKQILLFELNEFALYSIDMELAENHPGVHRQSCLGSVTDTALLENLCTKYKVETIYHAAAYKHVPLVEANASQGVMNNAYGTLMAAQAAIAAEVKTFVLISTDKAVRPTNIMGATKRVSELVLQALAAKKNTPTCFVMVRFGNVLGSSGSVVPRFRKQIAEGGPISLTHPDITRYFMSIPEAARLVIQAGSLGKGGEVFLLDMGEAVRIYDLAVKMLELSGLRAGVDIDIEITGLRPGEKLYEELLIDTTKSMPTQHPKIYAANEAMISWDELEPKLNQLFLSARSGATSAIVSCLKGLVSGYAPSELSALKK